MSPSYAGVYSNVSTTEDHDSRSSGAVPWVNRASKVHFEFIVNSGLSASELDPLSWLGRTFDTEDISDYTEDTSHTLGSDWRAFDAKKEYAGFGALTVRVATDVHNAGPTNAAVGYGDFSRKIELSEDDVPALPGTGDWQGLNVVGGVEGSIDGVAGEFSCDVDVSACYLEFWRDAEAKGYFPYENVVFTRDDNDASEILPNAAIGQPVPTADYLIFGTWQYVPGLKTAADYYEYGVFAGGGDPFWSNDAALDLHGTAAYSGSAHGKYYTDKSSKTVTVGSFEARVELKADFGNDYSVTGNPDDMDDYGRLSGTVDNFRYDGAATGFPPQLTLKGEFAPEAEFYSANYGGYKEELAAVGVVSDGQPTPSWAGAWQAVFFGNGAKSPDDHPTGVAGTFGATNDTDGMVGAFGAR